MNFSASTCVYIYIYIYIYIYTPSPWADCDASSIYQADLNSVFLLDWLLKAKEPSILYYIPIAKGRKNGFMPF